MKKLVEQFIRRSSCQGCQAIVFRAWHYCAKSVEHFCRTFVSNVMSNIFVDRFVFLSDRMMSVSNSSEFSKFSKFSIRSQQVIAVQACQIAKMRKLLIAAGIDPDAQVADPSLGPVISVEVKVNTAVQFTVAEAHVMYVRHARYRLYVRSMKVKGATQVKDQNCQEVVAGEVVMGKVAPNTLFALVQGIKAIRDSSQVGYPVLDAVLAVAPEVLVARVARLVLAQAMFQVRA